MRRFLSNYFDLLSTKATDLETELGGGVSATGEISESEGLKIASAVQGRTGGGDQEGKALKNEGLAMKPLAMNQLGLLLF